VVLGIIENEFQVADVAAIDLSGLRYVTLVSDLGLAGGTLPRHGYVAMIEWRSLRVRCRYSKGPHRGQSKKSQRSRGLRPLSTVWRYRSRTSHQGHTKAGAGVSGVLVKTAGGLGIRPPRPVLNEAHAFVCHKGDGWVGREDDSGSGVPDSTPSPRASPRISHTRALH
jgi:hypothetical protein